MLIKVRNVIPNLGGPTLVNASGVPRYWATVWMSFLLGDLAPSTLEKKLSKVELFYQHADQVLGAGALDNAIADLNVDALCDVLEAYFLLLKSRPITPATEERWQAALQFVTNTIERLTRSSLAIGPQSSLSDRLMSVQLLNSRLHIGRNRRPQRIRSLPADVVEALYIMLHPESPSNPFRDMASRWREYTVVMLLLHQGLRRGELLILPVDVIKHSFDSRLQRERYRMYVRYNEYEVDDVRYSRPDIKNTPSIRPLPVSKTMALIVQEYAENYRRKQNHSFLISSQQRKPLSTEGVTKMFQKICASLPETLRKLLNDHTGEDSFSAHNLRHTCVVVRLSQILASGVEMTGALEQLRPFFGWSRDSNEPLRYARANFEDRLASVWDDSFDDHVEIVRNLPARLK